MLTIAIECGKLIFREFLHMSVYHAALITFIAPGFWFAVIISNSFKGMTTMENNRDPYDIAYDLDPDQNWEIIYGKPLFPFSWLFVPWAGELKSHEEYMQMFGFKAQKQKKLKDE